MFGFAARNLVISHAAAPILRLSWQDVGSGVLAFAATAPALGLVTNPEEPARRVVRPAAIAGLVAMIVDVFVL